MRVNNVLLASLIVSLCACKPEAPAPETKAPPAPPETMAPATPETMTPATPETPAPAAPAMTEMKPVAELSEAEGMALAKKSNCLSCHTLDKKMVGPSFREVAAKYRGDAGAEARMAERIAKGGSGVWGVVVMPPSPLVGEADRKALAKFVLSLK